MNTIALIVTYSNRFHLLKKVIVGILDQGLEKIIVIDNNSHIESKTQLKNFEKEHSNLIKVVYLEKNYGPAGGFKRAFEEAYKTNYEFFWVFDDDTVPKKGAYSNICRFWKNNNYDPDLTVFAPLRRSRKQYVNALNHKDPELLSGSTNSFFTFNLFSFFKQRKNQHATLHDNCGNLLQAPWSGLFLNRQVVSKIGYPQDKFYCYTEDTEYTYRIVKNGGQIIFLFDSLIDDLDESWDHSSVRADSNNNVFLDSNEKFRIYYSTRNRVYFERNFRVSNIYVYYLNLFIYSFRLLLLSIYSHRYCKFLLFLDAVKDGLSGKLEENSKYNLISNE